MCVVKIIDHHDRYIEEESDDDDNARTKFTVTI